MITIAGIASIGFTLNHIVGEVWKDLGLKFADTVEDVVPADNYYSRDPFLLMLEQCMEKQTDQENQAAVREYCSGLSNDAMIRFEEGLEGR